MLQDFFGDFPSHHGFRRDLVVEQFLANDLAGKIDMVALGMGTSFVIGDGIAFFAEKETHKKNGRDAQVGEKIKYFLSGKRVVITADAGMIASDNEMRATEIFTNDGMEYRLLRAGVAHFSLQDGHNGPLLDIVLVNQNLVGVEDHLVGKIACLFLADDRVDEQAIHDGLCRLLHVFMPEMGNVAGLKTDHGIPLLFL